MAVLPFSVMSMLVDPGNATSQTGAFQRSHRFVDFSDVQYCRLNVGANVTAGTGSVRYHLTYSVDGVAAYTDLIPPSVYIGSTYTSVVGPWSIINNVGEMWIRAEFETDVSGVSHSAQFLDIAFR